MGIGAAKGRADDRDIGADDLLCKCRGIDAAGANGSDAQRCEQAIVFGRVDFIGLHRADVRFQIPVAAQIGAAGGIARSSDVGTGNRAEQHGSLQASLTAGEVAAVDEDVTFCR